MSKEKRLGLVTFQIDQHSELDIIQENMHVFIIYMVTQRQAVEKVGGSVCGWVWECGGEVSGVLLVVAAVAIWEKNNVILRWQRGKFLFLICISSVNRSAQINFRYCSCVSIVWHGSQTTCSSCPHFLLLFKSCIHIQVSVFFLAEEFPLMWFDSLPTPFLPLFLFFPLNTSLLAVTLLSLCSFEGVSLQLQCGKTSSLGIEQSRKTDLLFFSAFNSVIF